MANIEAYKNSNWVEGKSGNENGRPKKELAMTEALKDLLCIKDPTTKIERYKVLLEKAISMAIGGDGDMLKYLINRIEGMPQGSAPIIPIQINNYDNSPECLNGESKEYLVGEIKAGRDTLENVISDIKRMVEL